MSNFLVITRVAEFGTLIVYRRGDWCLRERLPRYVVARDDADQVRFLEDFRRLDTAVKWARAAA